MLFLGIDVGTSACKTSVFNENGEPLAFSFREYPILFPHTGWMELSPDTVWENIVECIRECLKKPGGGEISAVSISSQGEAVIPVDKNGKVLYNSIVTFDNRCGAEVNRLAEKFDNREMVKITGSPIHSMFTLPKIMWINANQKQIYKKTWKFLCYGDFVSLRLGAPPAIDYTMATRTQMFDINTKKWSDEILEKSELDKDKRPEAVKSGEIIGRVSRAAAEATGLPEGTVIVSGAHDQSCCAVGAGVMKPGTVMNSMGTTESTLCVSTKLITGGAMAECNIPCCIYAKNDLYAYLSFLTSSGSVLKWYKEILIRDDMPFNQYDCIAQERRRPSGVMLLPYFAGSGTPHMDDKATGVFSGLTLGTDRVDMYLAILEGTAFDSARNISIMKDLGISIDEIRCIGGGSKSDLWMQIKADVLGMPVTLMEVHETGSMGAAMLAASVMLKCGVDEIADGWCRIGKIFYPDARQHQIYRETMEKHKLLYIKALSQ